MSVYLKSWKNAWRFVSGVLLVTIVWALPAVGDQPGHGMVVTAQHEASDVGRQILAAGGNAIDAAVAVGYALAVVDPCCGNIGGGGFMLIHRADGHDTAINFRETAPRAATAGMFLDAGGNPIREASINGYRAVGVPGTVLGLDRALTEYGHLNRAAVIAPAIASSVASGASPSTASCRRKWCGNNRCRKTYRPSAVG